MTATQARPVRIRERLDGNWRFALGHPSDKARDFGHATGYFSYLAKAGSGDGAAAKDFDDSAWRKLSLPHDFAVELPFAKEASHSHGYKALGPGFPDHSVGWYRHEFEVKEAELGQHFTLRFDGVYRAAKVWVNGFYLGEEPSGHCSFDFDITDYLNYGGPNVIAVRVDATLEEGWYYEGAGIYRHVWLVKTASLHVPLDGIWVRTEPKGDDFATTVQVTVRNAAQGAKRFTLQQQLVSENGQVIATQTQTGLELPPATRADFTLALPVTAPKLWSLEEPTLYRAVTRLYDGETLVDEVQTPFGFRTVRFDPDHGLFLNGRHVTLKGTNNHQDHAGLGTALPDAIQDYRLLCLKAMGSNAYRCSHHPATPELLDACDRLGFLVIDENRSLGTNPAQLGQLEGMIRRDRNHPSVILWSLGNEEWAVEGDIRGARITNKMQAFAQRLDPTRRTTVAISGGWGNGISTVIDVMGYNYISHGSTDEQHRLFPLQPGVLTEETTTQSTRGVYVTQAELGHSAPVLDGTTGGNAETGWKHCVERPYLAGLFFWTGFDYRGESNPFTYPAVSSQFGILDSCGFAKDWFYYLKAWWTSEPVLHLFPHWNWPGRQGEPIEVWAFTNQPAVELFLDGQSLGKQAVEPNGHVTWTVPYAPGLLEARTENPNGLVLTRQVATTEPASKLILSLDYDGQGPDGRRIAVVTVATRDAADRFVPDANSLVKFALSGDGRLLGVGNGDPSSLEPDQYLEGHLVEPGSSDVAAPHWQRRLFAGLCQVILDLDPESEREVTLVASSHGLVPTTLRLTQATRLLTVPKR